VYRSVLTTCLKWHKIHLVWYLLPLQHGRLQGGGVAGCTAVSPTDSAWAGVVVAVVGPFVCVRWHCEVVVPSLAHSVNPQLHQTDCIGPDDLHHTGPIYCRLSVLDYW
jgi:hypothetical protein